MPRALKILLACLLCLGFVGAVAWLVQALH
jgi:hypothetical protein